MQVYSLQNPAVKQLTAQAKGAEISGDLDLASGYIERALRIQPQDPQLLQHMEQQTDYRKAAQELMFFIWMVKYISVLPMVCIVLMMRPKNSPPTKVIAGYSRFELMNPFL